MVILISFLAIYTYDFYPNELYDKSLDSWRLLTPGLLFSFFIVIIKRAGWTFWKLIFLFFVLLSLYSVCLMAGMYSYGIAVPFVGGIGAMAIRKLFDPTVRLLDPTGKDYLIFGFIAGTSGLFLFFVLQYALQPTWTVGKGFGFILSTWQLVFGTLWIKENVSIPKSA